jgi:uncharacterized protein YjbI with pentapeptide repeats
MKFFTYSGYVALGVLIGAATVAIFVSPVGKTAISQFLIGASLLLIGSILFALFSKFLFARVSGQMDTAENKRFVRELALASSDPTKLRSVISENPDQLIGLLPLAAGFWAATRALNYTALALGGVVGVGTLLTGYVQMERMAEHSRLMTIQNSLTEASRRSAQIIELASILESVQAGDDDSLVLARAANLSRSLRPYQFLVGESELSEFTSPERGQLLNMIVRAGLDFPQIQRLGADFSFADLQGIDLSQTNLCGINFSGSELSGANLRESTLCHADFSAAKLPEVQNFPASNFYGSLNEAIAPSTSWLLQLYAGNSFFGAEGEGHWATTYLRERREGDIFVWRQNVGDNGLRSGVSVAEMSVETLRSWSRYRQVGNVIYDSEDTVSLGAAFDVGFSGYDDYEEQKRDLALAIQSSHDRQRESNEIPSRDLPTLQISDTVELFGLPERTTSFENAAIFGMFEPFADFRYISPGDFDNRVAVSNPYLDSASDADLRGIDLSFSDLRYVDFGSADLEGANLSHAILPSFERLSGANLTNVTFTGAAIASNGELSEDKIGPSWTDAQLDQLGLWADPFCSSGEADQSVRYCIYLLYSTAPVVVPVPVLE